MDFGFYNLDCMEGMKAFPDKYFDLAIVDPPYGNGGGEFLRADKQRFGGVFDKYRHDTEGGWHGKQKYHLGKTLHVRQQKEIQELSESAEHGRASTQKNHSVGHSPGTGLFQRVVPCLTKPDYLGGQLL